MEWLDFFHLDFSNSRFVPRAAQKLAQNGYRFENNGSFTVPGFQRWLALLVAVSATLRVYLSVVLVSPSTGVTKDDISSETYRKVPTTFSTNKIADIEEMPRDKKACRCKFHANPGFPWIRQLSPSWDPGKIARPQWRYTQLTPSLYEILCPFPVIYSRLLYSKNSSSNRATRVIPFWFIIFIYCFLLPRLLVKNKFVLRI